MSRYEIVVVSMPSSLDRRARMGEVLNRRVGLRWSFWDGHTAESEVTGLSSVADRQVRRFGRALVPPEIGCFKSHFSLLRHFVESGSTPWLLVLEDDVWLDENFDLDEVLDFADKRDLRYFRLFAKMYKPAKTIGMLSGLRQVIRFKTDPYGTQAYFISRDGAKAFLSGLHYVDRPIDVELGRFWRHGLFPVTVFPFPAVEMAVPSAIGAERDIGEGERLHYRADLLLLRVLEKIRKTLANFRVAL